VLSGAPHPGKILRVRHLFSVILVTVLLGGCVRKTTGPVHPWTPTAPADLGDVVARVAGVPIFAAEVAAQAAQTGKDPRRALDDLIAFHLLAEHARGSQAWPPRADDIGDPHEGILVQRMLERELEPGIRGPENITDAELRVLYERALVSFVHPRMVEVATLEITVGRKGTAAVRATARETLLALRRVVDGRHDLTVEQFQQLGRDDAWRTRGVQSFRFLQGPDAPHSARFGAAVARLASAGETIGPIEDDYGVYIARYVADRPAKHQSFEEARAELRSGYYPRWRQHKFLEFAEQAAAGHEIEIRPVTVTGSGS
jgi:hypothetical protein